MVSSSPLSPLVRSLERALLALGGGLLGAPLLLSVMFWLFPALWPEATWLHDTTLVGVGRPTAARFSWPEFLHARYQQSLEQTFDDAFPARELFIRLYNEASLHLFNTSGITRAEPSTVGLNHMLYRESDVAEYCVPQQPEYSLEDFAQQVARLQTACGQRGTAFAVLISPSKAAVYPEDIPRSWINQRVPRPHAYDIFLRLLAARKVTTVDGLALTLAAKRSAPAPLFARGALHWNPQAVLLNGNALLAALQRQGKTVTPMEAESLRITDQPYGREKDLLNVMNLALPWRYPVVEMTLRRRQPPDNARLNAVFVGNSFSTPVAECFRESGQFAAINHFFYYRRSETSYTDASVAFVAVPVPPLDFEREIFSADALILEINSAQIANLTYAQQFVADALRHVDAGIPPARPLFAARDGQTYIWGDELGFSAGGPHEVERRALTGFSNGEPEGTWTDGPLASICLLAHPPAGDLVLEATTGALADPARHVSQDVEISMNGEPVGHWQFSTMEFVQRQMVIPRRLLEGTRHVLRFRPVHPVSPAEVGLGADARRLGLRLKSLRLQLAPGTP